MEKAPNAWMPRAKEDYQTNKKGTPKSEVLADFLIGKRASETSIEELRNGHSRYKRRLEALDRDIKRQALRVEENDIVCSICYEFMVSPTHTICGHTFCQTCLSEALIIREGCPICRAHLRAFEPAGNQMLAGIILEYVKTLSEDAQKTYEGRQLAAKKAKEAAKVIDINENELIDVRDTEYIWCSAKVLRVERNGKHAPTVLVHYESWSKIYDEFICLNSSRIAKHGTYTGRRDIPRYDLPQHSYANFQSAQTQTLVQPDSTQQDPGSVTILFETNQPNRAEAEADERRLPMAAAPQRGGISISSIYGNLLSSFFDMDGIFFFGMPRRGQAPRQEGAEPQNQQDESQNN